MSNSTEYKSKQKQRTPWEIMGLKARQSSNGSTGGNATARRGGPKHSDLVALSKKGAQCVKNNPESAGRVSKTQFNGKIWKTQATGMANRSTTQTVKICPIHQ